MYMVMKYLCGEWDHKQMHNLYIAAYTTQIKIFYFFNRNRNKIIKSLPVCLYGRTDEIRKKNPKWLFVIYMFYTHFCVC